MNETLPWLVGLGGMLMAAILGGLVYLLTTGRARARAQVAAATGELQRTEQQARDQAALLTAIVNTIADGVAVIDGDGNWLLHNPAAQQIVGVTVGETGPDEWQGHYGIFRVDAVTPFPTEEQPIMRALRGESTDGVEMCIRNVERPDGVLLSVSGRPLEATGGQAGAITVFQDITAVRRHEADLTAFAGVVAHDLKSPLAAVVGYANLASTALADHAGDPILATIRSDLDRVVAGAGQMSRLINDLLAYTTARDAPLSLQPVDLHAVAAQIIWQRTNHLRGAGTPMPDISLGPLPSVTADPSMIRHLLDNLIGNGLKYVPTGESAHLDITADRRPDGWTDVEVADRGIGIPDAAKPYVFDTFYRANHDTDHPGTGLGLAICRRIVDRHGGTIGVTDNPGGGTRFRFALPPVDRTIHPRRENGTTLEPLARV